MMNNPYYIDENGILIMGVFYTGQTFEDRNEYDYYEKKSITNNSVSSVKSDGIIDIIIL